MKLLTTQQSPQPQSAEVQALLQQMRDVHEPAAPGWWPPAPGWWMLALLTLVLAVVAVIWLRNSRRRRARSRYRIEGVHLLRRLDISAPDAAQTANELLKRVAITTYGRAACGNLTGAGWLQFLRDTADVECPREVEDLIGEKLYSGAVGNPAEINAVREFAINWVQRHKAQTPLQTAGEGGTAGV
ncbi:DUF4381 domain-containing protein [Microbulbifer sp. TYP-18]|uniref:DUF4381 domain-containing protein n=1 Tax=Microbulbifer sp. TYP-18 TaxID=3230024 RepID=UPI0034C62EAD